MSETLTAAEVVALLDLAPHPEGGWYRETFRDEPGPDGRARSTVIFFLLEAGQRSAWHRVDAVEVWHHHMGGPLRLDLAEEGEAGLALTLGPDLAAGQRPHIVIPAHCWQSAAPLGDDWTLVTCTVAPGFEFEGFDLAPAGWRPKG